MKKRPKRRIVLLIVLIAAATAALLAVYVQAKQKKILLNEWFVNEKNRVVGVDVSYYQADIDMAVLKAQGVGFIYIKATEGSSRQDERFAWNWKNAREAGLPSGAYHFFSFDSAGSTQAENFIRTVGPDLKGRLIPVVDVEYYGDKEKNPPEKADVVRELKFWLDAVEKQYGVKPMIYTRPDVCKKYLGDEFDEYKKWLSSVYMPLSWKYHGDWVLWQYLNRGELEGYSGDEKYIDLNVLNRKNSIEDLLVD